MSKGRKGKKKKVRVRVCSAERGDKVRRCQVSKVSRFGDVEPCFEYGKKVLKRGVQKESHEFVAKANFRHANCIKKRI